MTRVRRCCRFALAGLLTGMALLPPPVHACAACFGKSDDAMAKGMNMGIFALLAVVVFVLSGIGAFAIFLARRAARFASEAAGSPASASAGPGLGSPATPEPFFEPTK